MMKELSFSIEGAFVTQFGREKFFDKHDLKGAIDWLTGCLQSDQLTDEEITRMAFNILNGKAEVVGTYPNDDYRYVEIEGKENSTDVIDAIQKWAQETKEIKSTVEDLQSKLLFIHDYLDDNFSYTLRQMKKEYKEEYETPLFSHTSYDDEEDEPTSSFGSALLDSFMKRQHTDTEDDYGWLEPSGKFHPVEFAEHESWAENHIRTNMSTEEWMAAYVHKPVIQQDAFGNPTDNTMYKLLHTYGDYLVKKGWVLLHNPAQGIAKVTSNPTKPLTKAQKEFLYDYYIERNCSDEANKIWAED